MSFKARARRSAAWKTRWLTNRWRALPDFVVVGGQRCGTTSLYEALSHHHGIAPSFRKEVHFFDIHSDRGEPWYRANFPLRAELRGRLTGEATPNYLAHPDVPQRLSVVLPDAKLIVLLRNPVERMHSAWKLRTYEGAEARPFEKAVEDDIAGIDPISDDLDGARRERWEEAMRLVYVEKSNYADHLERWFDRFDRPRVLVMQSEKLFRAPTAGLKEMQDFLGIRVDPSIEFPHTNDTRASEIEPGFRRQLIDYFAPRNEALERVTGQTFDWS